MARRTSTTLRAPRLTAAERAAGAAHAARLIPVEYKVIAGPPGCPDAMTMLEDPERLKKGARR